MCVFFQKAVPCSESHLTQNLINLYTGMIEMHLSKELDNIQEWLAVSTCKHCPNLQLSREFNQDTFSLEAQGFFGRESILIYPQHIFSTRAQSR